MNFIITAEWVKLNASPNGGWTRAKLAAIGVPWPPKSGWLRNAIGRQITREQKILFEIGGVAPRLIALSSPALPTAKSLRKAAKREKKAKQRREKKLAKAISPPVRAQRQPPLKTWRELSLEFYASDEWRKLRYRALQLCGAKCQCCGASAKDGIVLHVDHIKPRYYFKHLELELSNLQILCADCNLGKGASDETDWRTDEQRAQLDHMRNL